MRNVLARLRRRLPSRRTAAPILVAVTLAGLLLVRGHTVTVGCFAPLSSPATADAADMPAMQHADWFASHPATPSNATAAPVDSFLVNGTSFQHAADATVVDTVKVFTGDAVLWKWVVGSHTVTSGTGSVDPNSGAIFNAASNSANPRFAFQFNTVGTFPFYCVFHEGFNMRGVVVVSQNPTAVPLPVAGDLGFVRSPWPNPALGGTSFRFAQPRPGRVRVTVLDAQGRQVALALDRDFPAGTFDAAWTGHTSSGAAAAAGVYYLRLELAGRSQARTVTIVR